MSERELAQKIVSRVIEDVLWPKPEDPALDRTMREEMEMQVADMLHGFRKPRVDRERLVQTLLSCNDPPIMQASCNGYEDRLARWHASARVAAEKRADAILALLSPPEVETSDAPPMAMTHDFVRAFMMTRLSQKREIAELCGVSKSTPQESDLEYAKRIIQAVKDQDRVAEASVMMGIVSVPLPSVEPSPLETAREDQKLSDTILYCLRRARYDDYKNMLAAIDEIKALLTERDKATIERCAKVATHMAHDLAESHDHIGYSTGCQIAAAIKALEPKP